MYISQCHKCHSLQWLEDEKHNKKHNKRQNNYMHMRRIMVEKRHVNLERTTRKIKIQERPEKIKERVLVATIKLCKITMTT